MLLKGDFVSRKRIDKEKAYDLYVNKNMEAKEVSELLGCTEKGLRTLIHRERWIKRPRERVNISKDLLYYLYVTKNLSRKEVAEELNTSEHVVKRRLKEYDIKKGVEGHIENIRKTCMEKYGLSNGGWAPEIQEKIKRTNLERYGSESYLQCDDYKKKNKETLERLGVTNVFQLEDVKKKSKETMVKKYGVEHNTQNKEIAMKVADSIHNNWKHKTEEELKRLSEIYSESTKRCLDKINATKRRNGTFNTSKPEQKIKGLLEECFPETKCQYESELYPFNCDFYIPCLDLYIEYQGFWSHGKHPFDLESEKDLEKLKTWKEKSKTSKFYKNAIETWTVRDPLKRKIAKQNNLNWIEFFSFDEFSRWFLFLIRTNNNG